MRALFRLSALALTLSASAAAQAPPPAAPPKATVAEFSSLRLMLEKGVISQAEYDSAMKDLAETSGAKAADGTSLVLGKWATTMYGFVDADHIWDSTQSFNDSAGNTLVARPGTYAGDNSRVQFGIRNSRIGFRLKAPEYKGIRTSATLEMDFLGTQLPVGSGQPYFGTENAFFTNPTFRVRHFNMKVETPIVDLIVGQYWDLFGWQTAYAPNSVQIQGLPGQVYSRTPQFRVSKTIKTGGMTLEVAVAAVRPPQRNSATPEGQGGVRLAIDGWKGMQTMGSTGSTISPASIALTGDVRHIKLPEFSAAPKDSSEHTGSAFALDVFIPILQAKEKKGNALSLTAEFASGWGTSDLYTGLNGGVSFPKLPNPTNAMPAPVYTPDIDPGIAVYDTTGRLHYIQWTSYIVGLQYYLPGLDGKAWVSANLSHLTSNNTKFYSPNARVTEDWFDFNVFGDVTPAVRVGVEYANARDTYVDNLHAINHRVQMSVFYLF